MPKRKPRADKGKLRKPYKHSLEAVQSKSEPIKEETRDNIPMTTPEFKPHKEITFEDLPEDIKRGVQKTINYRLNLGLQDDSESRKLKALEYYRFKTGG